MPPRIDDQPHSLTPEYFRLWERRRVSARYQQGLCRTCDSPREGSHNTCAPCRAKARLAYSARRAEIRQQDRARHQRHRATVIAIYGGCACCGDTTPEFLELDHVGGGGAADRRAGIRNWQHIARIARHGAPDPRFRLLCANCHTALTYYEDCPHAANAARSSA